jgi:hypothetical protein
MKHRRSLVCYLLFAAALAWLSPALANHPPRLGEVEVDVVTDDGRVLPIYPLRDHRRARDFRAYLAAQPQARYSINVRNHGGRRVGLVIAVDGRNILSGERSQLHRREPMYVLDGYGRASYSGWRTDRDHVHRFHFTEAPQSYAAAWGDYSAMGVIAVAVYPERARRPQHHEQWRKPRAVPKGSDDGREGRELRRHAEPGTGFGEAEHSHSRPVAFEAQSRPSQRYFFKYEWPQQLCERGVLDCRTRDNRFWPQTSFAPYPPGYRR